MGLEPTEQPLPMTVLRSLRPSDDRDRVNQGYVDAVAQGADVYESEYRIHRADDGTGVDIDITDRKRAELALAQSEARLNLAVVAGNIGIWDWDLATGR
jgi:PAS domain-containing protein